MKFSFYSSVDYFLIVAFLHKRNMSTENITEPSERREVPKEKKIGAFAESLRRNNKQIRKENFWNISLNI